MRLVLAVVAGAVTAAVGAVILGEYVLDGATAVVAGLLFGVIVAEVVTTVGKRRDSAVAVATGALAAAGLVWAAWISVGRDWSYVPSMAWVGVALGAVAAPVWVRNPGRRGSGSRPSP